jgi:hypothetical protein
MKYLSMFFIGSSNHDKKHMFSLTLEKVFFEKEALNILGCPSTFMFLWWKVGAFRKEGHVIYRIFHGLQQ